LRDHCETALSVLLESFIHEGVATTKNVEHDLRQELGLVASSIASIGDASRNILTTALVVDDRVAVLNLTTMTNVGLNKDIDEVLDDLLVGATLHNDDTPRLQWFRVWQKELLTTKVPAALSARVELLTGELDLGVLEKTGSGLEKSGMKNEG
jgi:hypothetical protein